MSDRGPRRDPRQIHVPAPDAAVRRPPTPAPAPRPERKAPRRRRPTLRRAVLVVSLAAPALALLGLLVGFLYARSIYGRLEKIPLADVLSPAGHGTNYLIVGSDTRDLTAIADAGLNPGAFEDGGGGRSDTMLLLRLVDGGALMMSIPRDLYVPIAETGGSNKINAAYNGGPRRLVLTVQQALGVPIDHYLEVDFVSFAKLVDSLDGIHIDFPHPAFDRNSGLDVPRAGVQRLDGPQALAFVRSRHYVEVIDGNEQPDQRGDLGRVERQQQFLKAVFRKLGDSRNPLALARAGSAAAAGMRVDDTLGLTDAMRLAWRLRSLDPTSVELPVEFGRNSAGSVLFLVEPGAAEALAQFR